MLTVREALELTGLTEATRLELKKHPPDYFVALDQHDRLFVLEDSEHNRMLLEREELTVALRLLMSTEQEQLIELFKRMEVCHIIDTDMHGFEDDPKCAAKVHVPGGGSTFGVTYYFDNAGCYLGVEDIELSEYYPRGSDEPKE